MTFLGRLFEKLFRSGRVAHPFFTMKMQHGQRGLCLWVPAFRGFSNP
jgi:hypothetical protein